MSNALVLQAETEFFERNRLGWLDRAPGKYALVKGSELLGIFDSEGEAIREGYRRFGNEPFLVKHIVEADVPLNFTSFNLGMQLPAFKSTVADLVTTGPALQISVGPSRELMSALAPLDVRVAPPHSVTALIDTGAHTTVLNPETVKRLGIQPVGVTTINTPSTTTPMSCNRYHVNVYFSEEFVVENVFAIEAPMGGVPYQSLIGRDILKSGTLLYAGRANQFTLSF